LREEALDAVERIWGVRAGDLDAMTDGFLRYCSDGNPVSIALQDVASRLERETGVPLEIHEAYNAPRTYNLGDRGKVNEADYRLYPAYSYTTAIATVEVEEAGRGMEVKDLYIFQDVGKPINPQVIAGQLGGSCLQALGYALMEEYRLKDGVPLSMNFKALGVPHYQGCTPLPLFSHRNGRPAWALWRKRDFGGGHDPHDPCHRKRNQGCHGNQGIFAARDV